MDATALCYFWGNMKKKVNLQNSFKQIYVLRNWRKKPVLVHISQNAL